MQQCSVKHIFPLFMSHVKCHARNPDPFDDLGRPTLIPYLNHFC